MMKNWLDRLLWGRIFHPRNERLFRLRIWLRVQWLRLTLWWREDVSFRSIIRAFPRPLAVLVLGLGLPFAMFWLMLRFGTVTAQQLASANPFRAGQPIPWQAAGQLLLLFVGLPAAFMLWAFRDYHVNATLANQRKDVNLKEFQEIQMRAAGALDEKLPAEAREQLQIAALHQLRAFLRGDFGKDFRRPAFELLLAGHAAAEARIGLREGIERWRGGNPPPGSIRDDLARARAAAREQRSAVDRERAGIIRDEWKAVFLAGFPLNGRLLDAIELPRGGLLARMDLTGSSFTGADLFEAHLEGAVLFYAHLAGANLSWAHLEGSELIGAQLDGAVLRWARLEGALLNGAHLEGADLSGAYLAGADLSWTHLEGAVLRGAHLEGANLRSARLEDANLTEAQLEGANLRSARLEGANLTGAQLEGADLTGALLDDTTILLAYWDDCSPEDRAAAQQKLRDRGARHLGDPPAGEA